VIDHVHQDRHGGAQPYGEIDASAAWPRVFELDSMSEIDHRAWARRPRSARN
jgi:hypothetical protein